MTVRGEREILVWDLPVRLFHWLLAASFAGAFVTAESERWHAVHVTLGYTVAGLVVFRLLWGLAGSRHARFASFVRGPAAVARYFRSVFARRPEHHVGHNPAGALAIVGLLGLAVATTAAGWALQSQLGGHWLEEVHEAAANAMLALVGVHVFAVLASSAVHRENLVRAMFTGRKRGAPSEGIRRPSRAVAAALVVAVAGFWWIQWQSPLVDTSVAHHAHGEEDDD